MEKNTKIARFILFSRTKSLSIPAFDLNVCLDHALPLRFFDSWIMEIQLHHGNQEKCDEIWAFVKNENE